MAVPDLFGSLSELSSPSRSKSRLKVFRPSLNNDLSKAQSDGHESGASIDVERALPE